MDFKQLQSYIAVVKYKSFTIAAEKLGISQPTISTHIRILESELDSQLVARTSKNFEITPRGWEMYECAQSILKLRDDMVDRWNGKESKVIRLGASTIPSAYILPEILPSYERQHRDVCFVIDQGDSRDIIQAVHKGDFDIGLVGMQTDDGSLEFQQFYQDRMVLITPATERYQFMQEQDPVPLKELLAEPMILREQGSGSGKSAGQLLDKLGIPEDSLTVTARINDQESIKNLVAGGLGVSIISEKAVQGYPDPQHLLKFELPKELSERQFYVIYQRGSILKDYVEEFADHLMKFYQ
ncbi:MAG: LysR family transcriptional regulator [Lachnospiraceae bacterium]|nr:LysR family transcriptional regulator [Lachnospiraceae bacterium]